MLNNTIELFWNYLYQRDLTSKDQIVKEALRVIRTKNYLEENQISPTKIKKDPEKLFQIMKDNIESENLGYFPGDRDFFAQLFELGKDFDILDFTFETFKSDRSGILFSPRYLINFILDTINQKQIKKILITEAEKILPELKSIIGRYKNQEITLTTENILIDEILKTSFADYKNVEVFNLSLYKKFLIKKKYDFILSIPTLGYKLTQEDFAYNFLSLDAEGIAIENLLNFLNDRGSLFVVVPAKFTFSAGELSKVRNWINKNYQVNFIYTLPEGTFRPYSGIKTYLLSLSKQKCEKISLGNLELKNNKFVIANKKEIKNNEFKQRDNWQVELFLSANNELIQKFQQTATKKIKIKEIAEIFRGKSVMKKDIQPGEYKVLNISDIEEGEINFKNMITIAEDARKIRRYELLPDDVVISCRGTLNKVAVFKDDKHKIIASANLIVIRPKEKILSDYLKIFLESPVGTTLIKSFQRGSIIMNINPLDIGELEITLFSLEEQRELIDQYNQERETYKEIIKRAEKRWFEQKSKIYDSLLR